MAKKRFKKTAFQSTKMESPLWFLVRQRQLGYQEFHDRYISLFTDEFYSAPLFALLAISGVEPYVKDLHILRHFCYQPGQINIRGMAYSFLYWALNEKLLKEPVMSFESHILMADYTYILPGGFSYTLNHIVAVLLNVFFGISRITLPEVALVDTLLLTEKLSKDGFEFDFKKIEEISRICQLWKVLVNIKEWFQVGKHPPWIKQIHLSITTLNSPPYLLKGLPIQNEINKLITILKNHEDLDYVAFMVLELSKLVPERANELQEILKDNPELDARRIRDFLLNLDPITRMMFFPTTTPILDYQVEQFVQAVKRNGLEPVLKNEFNLYREAVRAKYSGMTIANEVTIFLESIYIYPPHELIWLTYDKSIHVFAREDLRGRTNNPYNRVQLPKWVLSNLTVNLGKSTSYLDIWSKVVKRTIRLDRVIPASKITRRLSI